jgi:hypothetical protein
MNPADYAPISADEIAAFQAELDAAGEQLREVLGDHPEGDSPAIPFYLDGAAFLEAGYLMIEQLAQSFPQVFRALHQHHYDPLFKELRKGRMMWGEALEELPDFLRDYAQEKVQAELAGDDD